MRHQDMWTKRTVYNLCPELMQYVFLRKSCRIILQICMHQFTAKMCLQTKFQSQDTKCTVHKINLSGRLFTSTRYVNLWTWTWISSNWFQIFREIDKPNFNCWFQFSCLTKTVFRWRKMRHGCCCKVNEECSGCGQNGCNTYTCDKPTPSCAFNCYVPDFKCVCKPYYTEGPDGLCKPLQCPRKSNLKYIFIQASNNFSKLFFYS